MKLYILILPLILLSSCDFPKIIPSTFAKDYCSCRFVVGQSKDYCMMYAKQIVSPTSWSEDANKKEIVAKFLTKKTRVKFLNQKFGCQIQEN